MTHARATGHVSSQVLYFTIRGLHFKLNTHGWYNIGTSSRDNFLWTVRLKPDFSSMSKSSSFIPFGNFQSKWYKRFAKAKSTVFTPIFNLGHMLRPPPNGKNSKCSPL